MSRNFLKSLLSLTSLSCCVLAALESCSLCDDRQSSESQNLVVEGLLVAPRSEYWGQKMSGSLAFYDSSFKPADCCNDLSAKTRWTFFLIDTSHYDASLLKLITTFCTNVFLLLNDPNNIINLDDVLAMNKVYDLDPPMIMLTDSKSVNDWDILEKRSIDDKHQQQLPCITVDFSMPRKRTVPRVDLWYSPSLYSSNKLINELATVLEDMSDSVLVYPHIIVDHNTDDFYKSDTQCLKNRYCSIDPDWSDLVQGVNIIHESLRQYCLRLTLKNEHQSQYLRYLRIMSQFCYPSHEKGTTLRQCSKNVMKELLINYRNVDSCVKYDGLNILSNEARISPRRMKEPFYVRINGRPLIGEISISSVIRAICSSFRDPFSCNF